MENKREIPYGVINWAKTCSTCNGESPPRISFNSIKDAKMRKTVILAMVSMMALFAAAATDLYEAYKDTAFSGAWTSLASGEYTLSGDLCVTNAAGEFQEMRFG